VLQSGFLGRQFEQMFPYGIYTYVSTSVCVVGEGMAHVLSTLNR